MNDVEIECGICGDQERGPWVARIEDGALICAACSAGE